MKTIKRNLENYLAVVVVMVIIISFYFRLLNDKIFFSAIGAVITIYFGAIRIRLANDRIFIDLFNSFNEKYDKNFNDLLNLLKVDNSIILNQEQRNCIIDYFNLCSEEYLWYLKGRIPESVWIAWKAGIIENLKIKQIGTLYNEEMQTDTSRKSYYGLYHDIKKEFDSNLIKRID